MKIPRKKFLRSDFLRNVVTIMTGTGVAQFAVLAATPILTRSYSPRDFGLLLIYTSILSILGTCSTGKYERAILLLKDKTEMKKIVFLSLSTSMAVAFFLLIVLVLGKQFIIEGLEFSESLYNWLFTLCGLIIVYSAFVVFNTILNYQKRFKRLSAGKIVKAVCSVTISLSCIFFLKDARGLILGELSGYLFATAFVVSGNRDYFPASSSSIKNSRLLARRFKNFPLFSVPSDFMNMASAQMPTFFLASYFGSSIVGFYSLTKRVLDAPVNLFSTSVLEVFRQKASEQYLENGECSKLFIRTAKNLFAISFIPFLILFLLAPSLFALLFGEEWRVAGVYARIFSVYYLFKFVSSPLSYMFHISENQKIDFIVHIYIFFSTFLILNIPNIFYEVKDNELLTIYSLNFVLIYIVIFVLSFKFSKGK